MIIEICDLCGSTVDEDNKTEVIVKDHKGRVIDEFGVWRTKRRYRAVICDDCLKVLREKRFGCENIPNA